jgi:hypothetical protein
LIPVKIINFVVKAYLGQEQQEVVFDLSSEDLGSSFVGEFNNGGHALHKHPGLEQVLVEFLCGILDAWLLKLLTSNSI